MVKKLYISGLSFSSTDDSMRAAFATVGTVVSATHIVDRMTGRPKGFGFVEMSTEDEAAAAIAAFDGKEIDGRVVSVSEARPREERPQGSFNRGGGDNRRSGGYQGGNRQGGFGGNRQQNSW